MQPQEVMAHLIGHRESLLGCGEQVVQTIVPAPSPSIFCFPFHFRRIIWFKNLFINGDLLEFEMMVLTNFLFSPGAAAWRSWAWSSWLVSSPVLSTRIWKRAVLFSFLKCPSSGWRIIIYNCVTTHQGCKCTKCRVSVTSKTQSVVENLGTFCPRS